MLLTGDWQLYAPLLYFKEVEGQRPDVVSIDIHLLRRSWYFGYLERRFPSTIARTRPQVDAFVQELTAWERDPGLYARSPELTRQINDRFLAMLRAFVTTHPGPGLRHPRRASCPASAPTRTCRGRSRRDARSCRSGLRLRAGARERPARLPPAVPLETRGLFDGTIRFEPDDVVTVKVRPVYLAMIASRGAYLEARGRPPRGGGGLRGGGAAGADLRPGATRWSGTAGPRSRPGGAILR